MKTKKRLKKINIANKTDYFFTDVTNINDFDPKLLLINEITAFNSGSTMFEINCCKENNRPYVVFNHIECVFKKVELIAI